MFVFAHMLILSWIPPLVSGIMLSIKFANTLSGSHRNALKTYLHLPMKYLDAMIALLSDVLASRTVVVGARLILSMK